MKGQLYFSGILLMIVGGCLLGLCNIPTLNGIGIIISLYLGGFFIGKSSEM